MQTVVFDTNVLIAAGFNRRSHSRQLIEAVREGTVGMVWNQATLRESRRLIEKIPRLAWQDYADLFTPGRCFCDEAGNNVEAFQYIEDPDDRKFAALAVAAGAILVTSDRHLLDHRDRIGTTVCSAGEAWNLLN